MNHENEATGNVAIISLHAARRCSCGRGTEVPEMSERGDKVPLAIARGAVFKREAAAYFAPTAIEAAQRHADVSLRCARCGEAGQVTHLVFARGCKPRYALPREWWA